MIVLGALLMSAEAQAQPADDAAKEACAAAFEHVQELRSSGHLLDARAEASRCAAESCPAILAEPCLGWLDEIDRETPSLVVVVRDAEGRDVGAQVFIDGAPVAGATAGKPVPLDPGQHVVRVTVDSVELQETVVLRAGEKLRRVTLEATAPTAAAADPDDPDLTLGGWVTMGIGGAALVLGAITGGLALAKKSALDDACPTPVSCPADRQGDIDSMTRLAHASTAGLVIGAVAVGLGTVLLLLDAEPDDGPVGGLDRGLVWRF
ncbi:MAG: hypothetical protein R3B72_29155 [Polyangiaceae bacterium]